VKTTPIKILALSGLLLQVLSITCQRTCQHNNLQALLARNATVSINMTHLASEIQG
jgi:hypothetical protein